MADPRRGVPTLDELAADPSSAAGLSPASLRALLVRAAAALAALSAVAMAPAPPAPGETMDRALTVKEVAARIGLSEDYLYRHARDLPFFLPSVNGVRAVRFSERRLADYLRTAPEHPA